MNGPRSLFEDEAGDSESVESDPSGASPLPEPLPLEDEAGEDEPRRRGWDYDVEC
ncbi:MAG: hypothetical protein QM765_22340 [Myxococcales bacterium]